jgi:hypothetical protein
LSSNLESLQTKHQLLEQPKERIGPSDAKPAEPHLKKFDGSVPVKLQFRDINISLLTG